MRKNASVNTEEYLAKLKIEGFLIVKKIIGETVPSQRLTGKDTLSYFTINLDGDARKTICRFYFGTKKYLAILNADKSLTKHRLAKLADIQLHADGLVQRSKNLISNSR